MQELSVFIFVITLQTRDEWPHDGRLWQCVCTWPSWVLAPKISVVSFNVGLCFACVYRVYDGEEKEEELKRLLETITKVVQGADLVKATLSYFWEALATSHDSDRGCPRHRTQPGNSQFHFKHSFWTCFQLMLSNACAIDNFKSRVESLSRRFKSLMYYIFYQCDYCDWVSHKSSEMSAH